MTEHPSEGAALESAETFVLQTLAHYERTAESFREGTWAHDVTQNYEALLRAIHGSHPFSILDFGCGPGRDLVHFRALGHEPTGLDGCARFVEMARRVSRCEVLHQNFLSLDLPSEKFHGIFANASLFHVPRHALQNVLGSLWRTLRPEGVLFSSNPRGLDVEEFHGERFGAFHSKEAWTEIVRACGFDEVEHFYRPPGRPRHEQPWLATVWRKRKA